MVKNVGKQLEQILCFVFAESALFTEAYQICIEFRIFTILKIKMTILSILVWMNNNSFLDTFLESSVFVRCWAMTSCVLRRLTCQLTRDDRFSTIRRFSVRIGGGFRLKGSMNVNNGEGITTDRKLVRSEFTLAQQIRWTVLQKYSFQHHPLTWDD